MIKRINIVTGEEKLYKTKTEAAAELGLNESTVRKGVRDNRIVCGKYRFVLKLNETEEKELAISSSLKTKLPRILLFDIETSPLVTLVFQKQIWKARIGHNQVLSDWFILTFSYKWLGEDEVHSERVTGLEAIAEDDSRIIKKLHELFTEADFICGHNAKSFDVPNANVRFIVNGLIPPTAYRVMDTLITAQQQFGFTHNSLDALAKTFGFAPKIPTDFSLWKKCLFGDEKALEEMDTYCKNDVLMLESLYLILRSYMKNHPNLSLYNDINEIQCPHCISTNLKENGFYYTNNAKYITYRCEECGAVVRGKKTQIDKNKQKVTSIPGR